MVTLMPTLARAVWIACIASAVWVLPLEPASVTEKPSGLPQPASWVSASLGYGIPSVVPYGVAAGSWPSVVGGSMVVAMSPPSYWPPYWARTAERSTAYWTARRH